MSDENNQKKLNFFTVQNLYQAIGIIEDFEPIPDGVDHEHALIQAWQYLIDTGTVWGLQGMYGRTAKELIESGYCTPPQKS